MMRKPKSANQNSTIQHSSSVHYFAIAVMILTACSIALSGCSKFRFQEPTSFKPMPQPRSLTQRQQRSVDEALAKQDAERLAAQAEATAADMTDAEIEPEAETIPEGDVETQQQDIVAEAAQRANFEEAMTQVAQVSYETDIDESEDNPAEADSNDFLPTEFESTEVVPFEVEPTSETLEDGVRLIANADDLEGVPVNFARDEFDFSQANFLRPSTEGSTEEQVSTSDDSDSEGSEETASPSFGNAESLQLPLQPMLFNPKTRSTKAIYEGTLRPLKQAAEEFESEAEVARVKTETTLEDNSFIDSSTAFGTLAPLRTRQSTIKLESSLPAPVTASSSNSRLLHPIERATEPFQPPQFESQTVEPSTMEVAQADPEPIIESAEIFVVDPPVEAKAPTPRVSELQASQLPDQNLPGQPVVDASLSNASASYLQPMRREVTVDSDETIIPVEVFEDAIVVAEDMERELTATAIPSETIFEASNDFKVQPVSSTSVTSLCSSCGSANCAGCEVDHSDRGEPMFSNNDFAAPTVPGGEFVAPLAIPPATVPTAQPKEIIPASSEFGTPVSLDAPPETDSSIKHVAALPIVGNPPHQPATTSNVPPVGISTLMELNAVTWKSRLDEAIELAEARLNRLKTPTDSGRVNLRLLKALRGQMEQVELQGSTPGTVQHSENESQYWQHQLEAITAMLQTPVGDSQAVTDYHRHQAAHETLEHLRNAVSQLESIASLKVTSGQFCTAITGFGKFRAFPTSTFSPGQKMLVYCEVENYKSVEHQSATGVDFRTRLRGSFAIYDADGQVVQQAEFPSVDDVARKHRRDFYMYMPVTLAELPAGQYVLHALVEDIYGNKTASLDPGLKFSVK